MKTPIFSPEHTPDYIIGSGYGDINRDKLILFGFDCPNGYGKLFNQVYFVGGKTKDGRKYYRGAQYTNAYLYYDKGCGWKPEQGGVHTGWILRTSHKPPSTTAEKELMGAGSRRE